MIDDKGANRYNIFVSVVVGADFFTHCDLLQILKGSKDDRAGFFR
jgi:hypothetical protein